jgi:hypothetical protein
LNFRPRSAWSRNWSKLAHAAPAAPRLRAARVCPRDRVVERRRVSHVHGSFERFAQQRARFADGDDGFRAAAVRAAAKVAALELAAHDRHQPGFGFRWIWRRLDVGGLESLTNRTPAISATSSSRSRPRNDSTAAVSSAGAPPDRADRGRSHDVAHKMRTEQVDRVERHQPYGWRRPVRAAIDNPAILDRRAPLDRRCSANSRAAGRALRRGPA